MKTIVIGVGNACRGDDGVGLEVARRVASRHPAGAAVLQAIGEVSGLIEAWEGAERVVIIDASHGAGTPGVVRRIDATRESVPASLGSTSTHGLGVAEAVALARSLGRLPRSIVIYAVEGTEFGYGRGLSAEVEAALTGVVDAVVSEAR
jgi:hydrogenase maturation protease